MTGKHTPKTSTSSAWAALALGVATVLTYLAWLGWDRQRDLDPVTRQTSGPYEAWQIIGVVAVLALLAGSAAWFGHPRVAVAVIPAAFTLCWSVGASTDPDVVGANLWPIGAVGVALGSLMGTLLVAAVISAIRSRHFGHGRLGVQE